MFRPGMRPYIVPLVAGIVLSASAFLPWVVVGNISLHGLPDGAALGSWPRWVLALGALAAVLATLSLITRKNSRHPLLLVGLVALGIMLLSWRIVPQTIGDRARTRNQAIAIVEHEPEQAPPSVAVGHGIYLGLAAASVLVGFGLTIVIRRASQPYVAEQADDDV